MSVSLAGMTEVGLKARVQIFFFFFFFARKMGGRASG